VQPAGSLINNKRGKIRRNILLTLNKRKLIDLKIFYYIIHIFSYHAGIECVEGDLKNN